MCFIAAGMGGGTGTGAAPVIAKAAREQGILTVGVVTKPFSFEGRAACASADAGIEELQKHVDTLIVIPNQNLFRIANPNTTFKEAFQMADEVLQQGVRGITDLMVMPGLINLDFADVRSVMGEMGKAMMGTGEAEGDNRAIEAAEKAIANPLLDGVSMKGAKGVIISITGGEDMRLLEVDEAANHIRELVDPDANIIWGSAFNDDLDGKIRVSVVATGIERRRRDDARTVEELQLPTAHSDRAKTSRWWCAAGRGARRRGVRRAEEPSTASRPKPPPRSASISRRRKLRRRADSRLTNLFNDELLLAADESGDADAGARGSTGDQEDDTARTGAGPSRPSLGGRRDPVRADVEHRSRRRQGPRPTRNAATTRDPLDIPALPQPAEQSVMFSSPSRGLGERPSAAEAAVDWKPVHRLTAPTRRNRRARVIAGKGRALSIGLMTSSMRRGMRGGLLLLATATIIAGSASAQDPVLSTRPTHVPPGAIVQPLGPDAGAPLRSYLTTLA